MHRTLPQSNAVQQANRQVNKQEATTPMNSSTHHHHSPKTHRENQNQHQYRMSGGNNNFPRVSFSNNNMIPQTTKNGSPKHNNKVQQVS